MLRFAQHGLFAMQDDGDRDGGVEEVLRGALHWTKRYSILSEAKDLSSHRVAVAYGRRPAGVMKDASLRPAWGTLRNAGRWRPGWRRRGGNSRRSSLVQALLYPELSEGSFIAPCLGGLRAPSFLFNERCCASLSMELFSMQVDRSRDGGVEEVLRGALPWTKRYSILSEAKDLS